MVRIKGKSIIICTSCQKEVELCAKGICKKCYDVDYRKSDGNKKRLKEYWQSTKGKEAHKKGKIK